MAANKLQGAIVLIKSGDRQTGQRLLTEVLKADPKNETAWLWMSILVTGEQQRFCLEKVLSINPNHPQAREQLAKLTAATPLAAQTVAPAAESAPQPRPVDEQPVPEAEPAPVAPRAPIEGTPLPKVWLIPGKHLSSIIYLEGDTLLTFDALPNKASEVLEEVRFGVTPKQFNEIKKKFALMNVNNISLTRVTSVTLFGDALKIIGTDKSGQEKKLSTTVSEENSEAVLKALHERIGPTFERITRPISRLRVMMSGFGFLAFACLATGFFWWLVNGLRTELRAGESVRVNIFVALLMLIGPNGILCIGSVLMVIGIVAIILSLRKPPEETVLARVAAFEKSS